MHAPLLELQGRRIFKERFLEHFWGRKGWYRVEEKKFKLEKVHIAEIFFGFIWILGYYRYGRPLI